MTRTQRLARKLGLDNNPLRRRTDRIAACLGAGLLAAFLVGAPLLSIAAGHWAGRLATAEQRAERSWHLVSAVLLRGAPAPPAFGAGLYGGTWVPARWTAPDGRVRTGEIDVFSGLAKGQKVGMWMTQTGVPTGPPLTHRAVVARTVIGAAVAPVMLAIVLAFVAGVGRWVFDRRRARPLGLGMGVGRPALDQAILVEGMTMSAYPDSTHGGHDLPELEHLDEAECLRLISPGGIGRIVYMGRYGLTVLPVNYKLYRGAIVFRTSQDSPTGEDLQTGIAHAEYDVAFEIDEIDPVAREGWSVLIHGPAHHMTTDAERAEVEESGVVPWPGGEKEHAIRITPDRITGRRLRRS